MRLIETALALATIAVLLAVLGHPLLAVAPGLASALLACFIVRVALRLRRQRRARLVDVSNAAALGAEARRRREEGILDSRTVLVAVQHTRAEIAHAGASEARAVLDELEAQARTHPEGVPGHVVAAARVRFEELMRANLQ